MFSAHPDMGTEILISTLIVAVVGGMGSLRGAAPGPFLVGFAQTFRTVLIPGVASLLIHILLAVVLVFRPTGLFPARA